MLEEPRGDTSHNVVEMFDTDHINYAKYRKQTRTIPTEGLAHLQSLFRQASAQKETGARYRIASREDILISECVNECPIRLQ